MECTPISRHPLLCLAGLVLLAGVGLAQQPLLSPRRVMVPEEGGGAASILAGDLDGDGDLDAYVASGGGGRVYVNDGHASFVARPALTTASSGGATAAALADVDADGDLDVLIARGLRRQNELYLNDGAGHFTDASANLPVEMHDSRAVAAADFDGDGDVDAVFGNTGTFFGYDARTRLYLNDGTGVFTDATVGRMPVDIDSTTSLAAGDVDGDGDVDIVVGNEFYGTNAQNRLYLNDGTGVFTDATATAMPAFHSKTFAVALGDADGDGDLDLVTGNSNRANRLYRNDGAGVFAEAPGSLPLRAEWTASVRFGDVEGDGDLDLFVANTSNPNRLYLNDGAARFTEAPGFFEDDDTTSDVALADFDRDGDTDVLVGNTGQDRLYLNDGTGALVDPDRAWLPADSDHTTSVALADVDGDHDLDALLGHQLGGQTRLYLNDGSGGFRDASANMPRDADFTDAVLLGDVDGDSDVDAFIANCCGQPLRLYLNSGGVFTDATAAQMPSGASGTQEMVLGDLDGDRDPDLWFVNTGRNGVLINDGEGVFTNETAARLPFVVASTLTGALLDVDGDGDLDAFAGNTNFEQDNLYLNDGSGVFTLVTATHLPPDSAFTSASAVGDVDADGDPDLFLGGGASSMRLYLNDGTGIFQDASATHLPAASRSTLTVLLRDFDGDGDLDAFLGDLSGNDGLYENDGRGVFRDVSAELLVAPPALNSGTAAGDLDADGDLDLFVAISGDQNRVYLNRRRQLEARVAPRAGRPFGFDLSGPVGGTWALFVATGTARIATPFGGLRLDPASLVGAGAAALDARGYGEVAFVVPALSGAIGTVLYWQALVGAPFALTNLEPTTLSGL